MEERVKNWGPRCPAVVDHANLDDVSACNSEKTCFRVVVKVFLHFCYGGFDIPVVGSVEEGKCIPESVRNSAKVVSGDDAYAAN